MRISSLALVILFAVAGAARAQTAPVANAGEDVSVGCSGQAGTPINLDGTGSSMGEEFTYQWTAPGVTFSNANTLTPIGVFPVGTTEVTLTVTSTDPSGAQAVSTDTVLVTVSDSTPPLIFACADPSLLWPPNHKLRRVHANVFVFDACDAHPAVELVSIQSSEPDNGIGDGNTMGDIVGAEVGTDDRDFELRAERAGPGKGRTYSALYRVTDASGNSADALATVLVPHDRGRGASHSGDPKAAKKQIQAAKKAALNAAKAQLEAAKRAAKAAR